MKVFYALKAELLEEYKQTKDDLLKARSSMSDQSISEAKQEILKECNIYDFNPEDTSNLYSVRDGIANIPIAGMLTNKVDICSAFFGETVTTYQFIREAVKSADEDPNVKQILFHANSGGGYAEGCEITSQAIARCSKKTYAAIYDMAASACYWLISQCDEIISVSKTSFSGSIGVAAEIINRDRQDEQRGIKRQTVTNSQSKDKRPDYNTDEGLQIFVNELDAMYRVFTSTILQKREGPLTQKKIDELSGRVLISDDAISYGLIDKFIPLSDLENYVKSDNSNGINNKIGSKFVNKESVGNGFGTEISQSAIINAENNKTPLAGEQTEETMELNEFLAQNPDAKAKYDADIKAAEERGAKAEKESNTARIKKVVSYIDNENYPGATVHAKKVLSGEMSTDAFEGCISAFDMMRESQKSKAAKEETEATGDTPPQIETPKDVTENKTAEDDMKKAARYS